jgi:hypothetical protein
MAAKIADTEDMAVAITMVTQQSFEEQFQTMDRDDKARQQLEEMKGRLGMKTAKPQVNNSNVEDAQLVK